MKIIYIVIQAPESDESEPDIPVKAFLTKEAANEFLEMQNKHIHYHYIEECYLEEE